MPLLSPNRLPGNPIANVITIALGAIALVAAFLFGFVLLSVFLIAAAIFVCFVSLRVWWLRRKYGPDLEAQLRGAAGMPPTTEQSGATIDAEYRVIEESKSPDKSRR